jgi:DNA (cytosine-5)-methyltransferase 1
LNVVSLFSGVGGFDLGLERAGHRVIAQVENDPFFQRVLAARWPGVERVGRVETYARELRGHARTVDLLTGGFPCQDLSVAGKRAGLGGARSSLFYEYVRIAKALRPTWGLVENVPGLLSSHRGRDFWLVLQGLRECWPAVGYRILDSQHFGVPQRRRRVFLVGGPTEAGAAEVLALTASGGGDSPARGEAGTDVAASLTSGSHRPGVNDPGRRKEDDVNLVPSSLASWPSPVRAQSVAHAAIRRLTPLECEKLQGFPPGWTCLCTPLDAYAADPDAAALACRCPDSPRYRAMGNAVTVPVIEWIARRIARVDYELETRQAVDR